jgi:choline-phosphate cytidylyltransferase
MIKVITYGTYDLLHYGHIRLLERARALGDYLIVGVTADGFDQARGKINVKQSLIERMEAIKATGLADEVIVEEYEGQKIDDVLRYNIDIFAIGSDWRGKFDYLHEYCKVVYLERTQGVSSSEIRSEERAIRIGLAGSQLNFLEKFAKESSFVNGVHVEGIWTPEFLKGHLPRTLSELQIKTTSYEELVQNVDAIFIVSKPEKHFMQIKKALEEGKHVLCESPISTSTAEWEELMTIAKKGGLILMDAIRTAYSTAYYRMLLLVKSGRIGDVISVDASCSSLRNLELSSEELNHAWNSICSWGPNALLPVFQILGTKYIDKQIISKIIEGTSNYDSFTKITFIYPHAVASIKVGMGVKTEGELIVSGTTGYIYVPAPWWKTEYFEIRREDSTQNKRYFYQLDGEGFRYEIISFIKAISHGHYGNYINTNVSLAIVKEIEDYYNERNLFVI